MDRTVALLRLLDKELAMSMTELTAKAQEMGIESTEVAQLVEEWTHRDFIKTEDIDDNDKVVSITAAGSREFERSYRKGRLQAS